MAETEESTSGDSTDAFSEKFDPIKVLYAEKLNVPVPEAPLFDNINKFESVVLKGCAAKLDGGDGQSKSKRSQSTKQETDEPRRFQKHQEMVSRKQIYSEKNVISRMQKSFGPLAMLYQYMENKTRVKVCTRGASGIRGHVEAYIAAFDRHWNLALEDCFETWSRKIKRKAPASGDLKVQKDFSSDIGPKIIVKQKNKRLETLERHVPQLLLRGEQVVFVSKID